MNKNIQFALQVFEKQNGVMRSAQIFKQGIQPRTLYQMRDDGLVVAEGRGLYRLANSSLWSDPDLAIVSLRIPKGVICLISALYFHHITTQIPYEVYVALPKDSEKPRIHHPPHGFSGFPPNHSRQESKRIRWMAWKSKCTASPKPLLIVSSSATRLGWTSRSKRCVKVCAGRNVRPIKSCILPAWTGSSALFSPIWRHWHE